MPGRLLANMEEVEMLKVKLSWIFDIPAAAALPGPVPTTRHPPSLATGAYDPIMHGHYNYYTLHSNHHSKISKKGLTGQVVIPNDCPHRKREYLPVVLGRVQTGEQQSGLGRVAGLSTSYHHIYSSYHHIYTSFSSPGLSFKTARSIQVSELRTKMMFHCFYFNRQSILSPFLQTNQTNVCCSCCVVFSHLLGETDCYMYTTTNTNGIKAELVESCLLSSSQY